MSEMVERVARELAMMADHNNWEEFIPDAKAVIAAMRIPTFDMLAAAARVPDVQGSPSVSDCLRYQAMIDEALKR